jgi:hypothetical protein
LIRLGDAIKLHVKRKVTGVNNQTELVPQGRAAAVGHAYGTTLSDANDPAGLKKLPRYRHA